MATEPVQPRAPETFVVGRPVVDALQRVLGGNPHPSLSLPGQEVHVQWWGRDPASPAGGFLTNGLAYQVGP